MEKLKKNKILIYSILVIIVLIVIDQTSKFLIIHNNTRTILIKNVLEITYVENRGGAFGVGQNSTFMFIATNIVVLGLIIRFIYLQRDLIDKTTLNMLLAILAGGFSNLIDRLTRGFVVDFINLFPFTNFPKFNIADMYITIGWVILALVFAIYTYREIQSSKKAEV